MGQQLFFKVAFLNDIVNKGLLTMALQLSLVGKIPQALRYFPAVLDRKSVV